MDDAFFVFFFRSRINSTPCIKNGPFEIYWFSFTVNLMTLESVLQNIGKNLIFRGDTQNYQRTIQSKKRIKVRSLFSSISISK